MMKQDELEKARRKNAEMAAKRQAMAKEGPATGSQNVRAIQQTIKKRETTDSTLQEFDRLNCEIEVYTREITTYMIMTSRRLIERETASLARTFEINGKRLDALIPPHQQFAATIEMELDKRNHLDISNYVSAV